MIRDQEGGLPVNGNVLGLISASRFADNSNNFSFFCKDALSPFLVFDKLVALRGKS